MIKFLTDDTLLPNREDIARAFRLRLGVVADLFEPITVLHAEQVQHHLNEFWLQMADRRKPEMRRMKVTIPLEIDKSYRVRVNGYNCPCKQKISTHDNYCSGCGREIEWGPKPQAIKTRYKKAS